MNQELIGKYVAGELGREQAEEFETYCVAHPEFARQVEYEQRLKAGIVEAARGPTEDFVRSNYSRVWKLAAAASFLVACAALLLLWQRGAPFGAPLLATTAGASTEGIVLRLALVRGIDSTPALAPGTRRVEIVGLFDSQAYYSVSLQRLDGESAAKTLGAVSGQHPASPISLEVMLDGDRLAAGSYSLRVRRQASDDEPLDFAFTKP